MYASDEAGDKALKILLDGAILYTDLNGFKIYVKPGNEFEAQVQWFLLDPREIIHYVSNAIFRSEDFLFYCFCNENRFEKSYKNKKNILNSFHSQIWLAVQNL